MNLLNTPTTYGLIFILLHWLVAVAVIGLFVSGLWMVDLGYYDDIKFLVSVVATDFRMSL